MRVHFVPQGVPEDKELMFSGILYSQAEKVFIIRNSERRLPNIEKRAEECVKQILEHVHSEGSPYWFVKEIDSTSKSGNFFDIMDSLGKFHRWIMDEIAAGNEVSVNISSGNKIVSFALMMAAIKNGADVFYFIPEDVKVDEMFAKRLPNEEGYFHKRPRDFIRIHKFPLEYMQDVPLEILSTLEKLGGKADSYTQLVITLYPEIDSQEQIRSKRVEISSKVRMLEALGYLKTKRVGVKREIHLTPLGRGVSSFWKI